MQKQTNTDERNARAAATGRVRAMLKLYRPKDAQFSGKSINELLSDGAQGDINSVAKIVTNCLFDHSATADDVAAALKLLNDPKFPNLIEDNDLSPLALSLIEAATHARDEVLKRNNNRGLA